MSDKFKREKTIKRVEVAPEISLKNMPVVARSKINR